MDTLFLALSPALPYLATVALYVVGHRTREFHRRGVERLRLQARRERQACYARCSSLERPSDYYAA